MEVKVGCGRCREEGGKQHKNVKNPGTAIVAYFMTSASVRLFEVRDCLYVFFVYFKHILYWYIYITDSTSRPMNDSSTGLPTTHDTFYIQLAPCGTRAPLFPLVHFLPHLFPFSLLPFFHWLYLFSSFVHPFPFYQNSPTPFLGRRS